MNSCNCNLCVRTAQFRIAIDKIPESDKEFWEQLYNHLCNVEVDLDYYKAVVEGTWPTADQVIVNHRGK